MKKGRRQETEEARYRKNVGIVLLNKKGQVLIAERAQHKSAWQFPQGGIDRNETVEQALFRELKEELGLEKDAVKILAETSGWVSYEIPLPFRRQAPETGIIGQKQKWFLLKLVANDSAIQLNVCHPPEFVHWRWVDYWYPIDCIIPFKRSVYETVLKEFYPLAKELS